MLLYDDVGYCNRLGRIEPMSEIHLLRLADSGVWYPVSDRFGEISTRGPDWATNIRDRVANEMETAFRAAASRLGLFSDKELISALRSRGYRVVKED